MIYKMAYVVSPAWDYEGVLPSAKWFKTFEEADVARQMLCKATESTKEWHRLKVHRVVDLRVSST